MGPSKLKSMAKTAKPTKFEKISKKGWFGPDNSQNDPLRGPTVGWLNILILDIIHKP